MNERGVTVSQSVFDNLLLLIILFLLVQITLFFFFFFCSSSFSYLRPRSFSRAISDEGRHQLPLSDYQGGGGFA